MRILITNDDGINAKGLKILQDAASGLSNDIWTVAPETNQSGVSHALSLSQPLRIRHITGQVFAVNGTPTDCVIIAVRQLMDKPPDLVLSGINIGQNIADHITYSGTVAGALEGAILGIRSIALSQAHNWNQAESTIDWSVCRKKVPEILPKLIELDISASSYLNINFPVRLREGKNEISISRQARRMHGLTIEDRIDGVGQPYYWLKFQESLHEKCDQTDIFALEDGRISITPIKIDMTDHELRQKLERALC